MENFNSFEELYQWATKENYFDNFVKTDSEIKENALKDIDKTFWGGEFARWLESKKRFKPNLKKKQYGITKHLTKSNWDEFFGMVKLSEAKWLNNLRNQFATNSEQLAVIEGNKPQTDVVKLEQETASVLSTKSDKLKARLDKYGFFKLSKVQQLSEPKKQSLVELITANGLPYSIAMFWYLDFLEHLENEHFKTKCGLNKEISEWFNSDKR